MLVNFLLGKRDLLKPGEISEVTRKSPGFDQHTEGSAEPGLLLLFRTSQQQTWLVATPERLYCVLDDVREPRPVVKWVMPKNELVAEGNVIVPITVRDHSDYSGYVNIGSHENWLYTKALFFALPVQQAIEALIRKQMIDAPTPLSGVVLSSTSAAISGWSSTSRTQKT